MRAETWILIEGLVLGAGLALLLARAWGRGRAACRGCGITRRDLPAAREWAGERLCRRCWAGELHRELGEQMRGGCR